MLSEIFLLLFLILLIVQVICFVKAIRLKSNKYWVVLFTIIISSAFSIVLLWCYTLYNEKINMGDSIINIILCIIFSLIYIVVLLISLITKIFVNQKIRKANISIKKMEKSTIKKCFIIPISIIILLSTSICFVDYTVHMLSDKKEMKKYNEIKEKELNKMLNFINSKYNMKLTISDCVYYREEDYSSHRDIFGNGKDYNIPYIGVFEDDNRRITVADRKGYISDNKQLNEINRMLAEYFKEKTQIDFEFVEISKSYVGSFDGDDNVINKVLQTKYNNLITNENISEFLDCVLEEEDLCFKFYIRDVVDRAKLIEEITKKLSYLEQYMNIDIIEVIGYDLDSELVVDSYTYDFDDEYLHRNTSEDYNDSYKFGNYYIDKDSNEFVFSAKMQLDRGYNVGEGEFVNGWVIKSFE